ncbi:MAG: hypothetical protein ACFCD0_02390, partial [Gemmataceae bacterium]
VFGQFGSEVNVCSNHNSLVRSYRGCRCLIQTTTKRKDQLQISKVLRKCKLSAWTTMRLTWTGVTRAHNSI